MCVNCSRDLAGGAVKKSYTTPHPPQAVPLLLKEKAYKRKKEDGPWTVFLNYALYLTQGLVNVLEYNCVSNDLVNYHYECVANLTVEVIY